MTTDTPTAPTEAPPTLAPGLYCLNPRYRRWWRHDELTVIWHDGRWCVVPTVALAALPEPAPEARYDSEEW